jgi:hypothetical protein
MSAPERVNFAMDGLGQQLHVLCGSTKVLSAVQTSADKRMKHRVGDC